MTMSDHLVPNLVYGLCALTSILCAVLMVRSWLRTRQRLHLGIGLGFVGLAANNSLLVLDLLVVPSIDLVVARAAVGLAAIATLLFALIWEAR
jgi:hypothetical protein